MLDQFTVKGLDWVGIGVLFPVDGLRPPRTAGLFELECRTRTGGWGTWLGSFTFRPDHGLSLAALRLAVSEHSQAA